MALTVVIAPDSFKGSIDASSAALAIARGWLGVRADDDVTLLPQADGGEGTIQVVQAAAPSSTVQRERAVTGPDGRPVDAAWLLLDDGTALIELAATSGLPLMATLDPLGAHTRGLGEVIAAAIAAGARSLVIALGGSASTDGGAGALLALGLALRDAHGDPVPLGGRGLGAIAEVSRERLIAPPRGGVTLLTDVRSPLLGAFGAATVFGPQKGATAADVVTLEAGLTHFAELLGGDPAAAGSGAAGGTAYGLSAAWGASIVEGAPVISRLSGLDAAAAAADVVITGEGRFDEQSGTGKTVGHVLSLAKGRTVVIAGQLAAPVPDLGFSLSDLAGSAERAQRDPARWLEAAGSDAALAITPTFRAGRASQ